MRSRPPSLLLRDARPPLALGLVVAAGAVALITLVLFPLRDVAPAVSLGVAYLLAVLLVSTYWGFGLGIATALASAAAFNFFHIPPTGRFTIAEGENWVALVVFLISAAFVSSVAETARRRAVEAEARRREADLAAELARVLLGTPELRSALGVAARRIAEAFALPSAAIELEPRHAAAHVGPAAAPAADRPHLGPDDQDHSPDERRLALPVTVDDRTTATLVVPHSTPAPVVAALRDRVVPGLAPLLAAAVDREALTREVVETGALRRSDEVKTAILRAVSHDLRSPLTAILAAGDALGSSQVDDKDRRELSAAVVSESRRLAALVDKLLDLSRLQAGTSPPRPDWCSLEEVIATALDELRVPAERVKLALDPDLPLIQADAAQLERAFANLLENALRVSGSLPVSVRARASGPRVLVRIVDRGPGIPLVEQARLFEPFYRGDRGSSGGSGLGLAIVKGFVEANGGSVRVESLPGQGTSFVVEFPLPPAVATHERPAEAATRR